jgi:hypothetical protein
MFSCRHATIVRDRFAFDLRASAGIAWTHVTGAVMWLRRTTTAEEVDPARRNGSDGAVASSPRAVMPDQ